MRAAGIQKYADKAQSGELTSMVVADAHTADAIFVSMLLDFIPPRRMAYACSSPFVLVFQCGEDKKANCLDPGCPCCVKRAILEVLQIETPNTNQAGIAQGVIGISHTLLRP